MEPLMVTSVSIRDVRSARQFAMRPGRVNMISGVNGSGKSTALDAIQVALGGRGTLGKLARIGEQGEEIDPEVVLILGTADDDAAVRVECTGDERRVLKRVAHSAAFEEVPRPAEWLSSLFDPHGANPVRFLNAADKDRALMLLEALPLRFERPTLLAEMGVTAEELRRMGEIPGGLHPLEEIAMIRDAVFRTRTGVGRDQKQQAASAEQLRRIIPAVLPEDPSARIAEKEQVADSLAAEVAREEEAADARAREAEAAVAADFAVTEERVIGAFKAVAAGVRRKHDEKAAAMRAETERLIAIDQVDTDAQVTTEKVRSEELLKLARQGAADGISRARRAREEARAQTDDKKKGLALLRESLAALRIQAKEATRASALHQQAMKFDQTAAEFGAEYERLTRALDALDLHARRLGENLPIEGLTIENKLIRVNGVPFESLNAAERMRIAVTVSALRARGSRLPVVFVDGAEALDETHFRLLVAELKAQEIQAFVAAVRDHELRVEVA